MSDHDKPPFFSLGIPVDGEHDAEIMEKVFTELRFRLKSLTGTKFAHTDALSGPAVLLLASLALTQAAESVIKVPEPESLSTRTRQAGRYFEVAATLEKLLMEMILPLHVAGCPYVDWLHLEEGQVG